MPTGYTAAIKDDISFEDFVLRCARAFGSCVHQIDSNASERPKLRTPNEYYKEKLKEAETLLETLNKMGGSNRIEYGKSEIQKDIDDFRKNMNDVILLKTKYENMLNSINNWTPPTPEHIELKKFMIDQITQSIKFDCNVSYYIEKLDKLSKENPLDRYNMNLNRVISDIKFFEDSCNEELSKVSEANKWILDLYSSLGIEYK